MNSNVITVAFLTNGGAGSLFIHANFILHFRRYISDKNVKIVVYGHKSQDLNDAVFKGQEYIDEYFNYTERSKGLSYDVCINTHFYPEVLYESEKIKYICPRLHELLEVWRKFIDCDSSRKYCVNHPLADFNVYLLAILNNKNCLNVSDIDGRLNIGSEYSLELKINKDERNILEVFGLEAGKFITMQRGAAPEALFNESPKVWSLSYFEELARLLKLIYPKIKIVQLGESSERSGSFKNIDVDLTGKTDWEDLKILLKNAWLHIDGECGMVHLRKALKSGPSVVLFGPTPMDFYGYPENINLRSNECKHWCARLTATWSERCPLNLKNIPCMISLTPYKVMAAIEAWRRLELYKNNQMDSIVENKIIELLEEKDIDLDEEYVATYLQQRIIYHYEIEKVKLKDLFAIVMTDEGFQWMTLKEIPAYEFLKGNKEIYNNYIALLQEKYCDRKHSMEHFCHIINVINRNGFDYKRKIVVEPNMHILDGQHRAAWLMNNLGEESEVDVLKIYSLTDGWDFFPFDRVKKGSKIIIYGMGEVGKSYTRQVQYTKWCTIMFSVDMNYQDIVTKEHEKCLNPEILSKADMEYDSILIASLNDRNCRDIFHFLLSCGIDKNKIICKCLVE